MYYRYINYCELDISMYIHAAHESNNALVRRAKDEKWMLFTFRGGLETLAIALGDALTKNGVKVHMNAPCTGVKFTGNGAQVIHVNDSIYTYIIIL